MRSLTLFNNNRGIISRTIISTLSQRCSYVSPIHYQSFIVTHCPTSTSSSFHTLSSALSSSSSSSSSSFTNKIEEESDLPSYPLRSEVFINHKGKDLDKIQFEARKSRTWHLFDAKNQVKRKEKRRKKKKKKIYQ
jgi:hypothetical protein